MIDINLHDAEITGIEHKEERKQLLIKATLHNGEKCQIIFQGIEWWELCSFGIQNVLFSITPYDHQSLTDLIINDQDISEPFVLMVRDGHHKLFVLDASVGLSGWVVAAEMVIEPVSFEPPTE